ncbi:MAG TPA: S53 family peptidase [Rhodanobacteraceae bacterium]|nr:S53 family peptidase [Rhodanobacteraceae bacterium]
MLTLRNLRKTALVLAVTGTLGVMGAALAASSGTTLATISRGTQLVNGDAVSGALSLSHPVHVTIALKLRNPDQLRAFNAKPHAPMSRAQLSANHLPTSAQAQAVANFLKNAGFTNVSVSRNRMLVSADGNAAIAAHAFNTSLAQVRTRDGRVAFANTSDIRIPAGLRDSVQAVLGLQEVHQAHINVVQAQGGTNAVTGHNPLDFPIIYGASGLNPATDMNVAVWGWGSMAPTLSDLARYESDNSLPSTSTHVVCSLANGSVITNDPTCQTTDQGSIEWDLDSQDIVAMTGGVNSLTFYAAPSGNNGQITTSLNVIVDPPSGIPLASVINASFGECERFEDSGQGGDGSAQADDALFQIGQAQGQTFSVSTGDSGYNNCGDKPAKNSASYPASSPYVIAVAGTTLNTTGTTYGSETVWRSSGGSPSSFESAPSWQVPKQRGTYKGSRGPDVAFDGDPNSGAIVYVSAYGGYVQVGGTSLSAPLFAGSWARLISNGAVSATTPAGQQLYAAPYGNFHDVKSGNNGGFKALPGWDWASGRGSLDVSKF